MNFKELNTALTERAFDLCAHLFPNGKRSGPTFKVGSVQGDAGHSLSVQLEGPKAGRWTDFASDEGGDLIALIEQALGLSPVQAADFARQFLGLPAWAPEPNTPPPFDPLRFGFKRREDTAWRYPSMAWTYRDAGGVPFAWVARFDRSDGGKDVLPIRLIEGKHRWKGYTGEERPPIYGLDRLAKRPDAPVLVVEGEKTADAAAKLFPNHVCITWQGGSKRVDRVDWSPLFKRPGKVILWPDADAPGRKAMNYVRTLIAGSHMVATKELPEGWDLADAPPEEVSLTGLLAAAMVDRTPAKEEADPMAKYMLPKGCELSKVEPDILKYKVFEFGSKVWGMRGSMAVEVSNCTVNVHQHIITKDGALALVTLANQQEREQVTMDVPFDSLSTSLTFIKLLGNRGNFQWFGTESDFVGYKRMLMDRMGKGRIITELGGQPEGFFVFANAMVNGSITMLDRHGCFEHEGQRFYVPAGNHFYQGDPAEFSVQKRLRLTTDSAIDFGTWNKQLFRCYGEHAYMATAFALATAFSGHIFNLLDGFPMLFLHGPGGSGKDQLIKFCQGLFGRPQPEIFLSGPNTDKGMIKMFAEFNDIPLNLAEYRNSLKKDMDELLKSMWGRIGYRIAAMRGKRTETIPICCSAYVTGNDYPNRDAALMRRLLIEEVPKRTHTAEDIAEFATLRAMAQEGYSNILPEVIKHRPAFVASWYADYFKTSREILIEAMGGVEVDSSMMMNMQVLHGTMRFFADRLPFAYTADDMAGHMATCMRLQLEKRSEGSEVSNFWTCFAYAFKAGRLHDNRDFKITGNTILFYWGDVFAAYSEAHQRVFGEKGEKPTDMRTKLERHPCWIDAPKSGRIGGRNTSAIMCDIEKTGTNLRHMLNVSLSKFDTQEQEAEQLPF